jgi:hypothetical protein
MKFGIVEADMGATKEDQISLCYSGITKLSENAKRMTKIHLSNEKEKNIFF